MTLELNLISKQEEVLLAAAQAKGIAPKGFLKSLIDELSPEAKIRARLARQHDKTGKKRPRLSMEEYNAFCNAEWDKLSPESYFAERQPRKLQNCKNIVSNLI